MQFPFAYSRLTNIVWIHAMCTTLTTGNYLSYLTVCYCSRPTMFYIRLVGASLSELHSGDVNGDFVCLVCVRRASCACANHITLWTGVRWLHFVRHQHSNSKQWIKQKEHKKANVDQELELKKRPSKERRGWQGEEKKIENAEQELEPKKRPSRENSGWQDDSREQYRERRAKATARAFLRL